MNQLKFIHVLLKQVIGNALTFMDYAKNTPDGAAYIHTLKDVKRPRVRRLYVSVMLALDNYEKKYGAKMWAGRVRSVFRQMITIADTDHVYSELCDDVMKYWDTLTYKEIDEYEKNEGKPEHNAQKFKVEVR